MADSLGREQITMTLPYGVNLIFAEDTKHFWLSAPYNREFIEALGINMIPREWSKERKMWLISSDEFHAVYDLVRQFYGEWVTTPIWGFMEGYNVQDTQAESLCNPKKSGHAKKRSLPAKQGALQRALYEAYGGRQAQGLPQGTGAEDNTQPI
jgi:hypothetical protein